MTPLHSTSSAASTDQTAKPALPSLRSASRSDKTRGDGSRFRPWFALALVILLQGLLSTWVFPYFDRVDRSTDLTFYAMVLMTGAILVQPALVALATAFGPGAAVFRIPFGVAAVALSAHLSVFGISQVSRDDASPMFLLTIPFLYLLLPLEVLRRWRGWRVLPPGNVRAAQPRLQFGLGRLMIAAAAIGGMLAVARWFYVPLEWPKGLSRWVNVLTGYAAGSAVVAGAALALVPLVALVLGGSSRIRAAIWAVVVLPLASGFIFWALRPGSWREIVDFECMLAGGWLWALLCLLILRLGGWRLERAEHSAGVPASAPAPDATIQA